MKLLAAVDRSKASSYIIEAVHRVAMATDAEVVVLTVENSLPTSPGLDFSPAAVESAPADVTDLADLVKQLVDVGVNAEALILRGRPEQVILEEADQQDVELIVVGSHGHGLLFDALVGSVSAHVLRHSKVPVLVVPVRGL